MDTAWTQELIDNLGRLWAEGHSTAGIGARPGRARAQAGGAARCRPQRREHNARAQPAHQPGRPVLGRVLRRGAHRGRLHARASPAGSAGARRLLMLRYMLDTNICIYVIKNRPEGLRERFNRFSEQLSISAITLAELISGAEKSARPTDNLAGIERLSARLAVLPFAERAA